MSSSKVISFADDTRVNSNITQADDCDNMFFLFTKVPLSGFTQVREKSGKILFPQGQGKVSEF